LAEFSVVVLSEQVRNQGGAKRASPLPEKILFLLEKCVGYSLKLLGHTLKKLGLSKKTFRQLPVSQADYGPVSEQKKSTCHMKSKNRQATKATMLAVKT